MRERAFFWFCLIGLGSALALFGIDQAAKLYWFGTPDGPHGFFYLGGFIQSIAHYNYGITFNIPLPTVATLLVTAVALLWVIAQGLCVARQRKFVSLFFLGLIAGGALGNAYDRITLHYVRDWLLLWNHSAINLADLGILVGAIGYGWMYKKQNLETQPAKT